jgi:hypothetical protein
MSADVLKAIVDLETEMYRALNTEPPITDDKVPPFRTMRWMTYSVLSDATQSSWMRDLCAAKADGRNVLTEKYALMDNTIEHFHQSPLIPQIVEAEVAWMDKLHELYPHLVKREPKNVELFHRYSLCELESWSDRSLELYLADVTQALEEGRNLCEERYNNLHQRLGRESLAEMEKAAAAGSQPAA